MSTDGKEVANILENLLPKLPSTIQNLGSDAGTGLVRSKALGELMKEFNLNGIVGLSRHSESQALCERANLLLRQLIMINCRYYKTKNWVKMLPIALRQFNSLVKSYFGFAKGKIQTIRTTPLSLAFLEDRSMTLEDLLGNPPVDHATKLKWKSDVLDAMQKYEETRHERQKQLDDQFKSHQRIVPGSHVLIRRFSRYKKRNHTYTKNIFKVLERHNRKLVVSSVFGRPQVLSVYIGNVKLFQDDVLLQFLSPELCLALGAGIKLDADRQLPFELESEFDTKGLPRAESIPENVEDAEASDVDSIISNDDSKSDKNDAQTDAKPDSSCSPSSSAQSNSTRQLKDDQEDKPVDVPYTTPRRPTNQYRRLPPWIFFKNKKIKR